MQIAVIIAAVLVVPGFISLFGYMVFTEVTNTHQVIKYFSFSKQVLNFILQVTFHLPEFHVVLSSHVDAWPGISYFEYTV